MQYLYNDGELFYFMDNDTYEQISINSSDVGESLKFVKENEPVKIMSHNGNILGIEAPVIVELKITETEPGIKGDTATNVTKPAIVETGASINVPLFINIDDVIKIDTRTGEYIGRA